MQALPGAARDIRPWVDDGSSSALNGATAQPPPSRRIPQAHLEPDRMNAWTRLTFDAMRLTMEANAVIAQRTWLFATGGAGAQAEASRMVAEKIDAGLALQAMALTGGLGATPQQA